MQKYLREGLIAGTAGGFVMGLFLLLVGEGSLGDAIGREALSGGREEMFSRGAQQMGGFVGATLYGALLGVVLGITVALVRHRLEGDDWKRSIRVATAGFISVIVVPFVKYPASPPGVGDPDTIGRRTAWFVLLVGISVAATWAAWRLRRTLLARRVEADRAVPAALGAYLAMVGLAVAVLPQAGDTNALPVDLVWRFRLQSLGGSALLFAVAGLVLGARLRHREAPAISATGVRAHA